MIPVYSSKQKPLFDYNNYRAKVGKGSANYSTCTPYLVKI